MRIRITFAKQGALRYSSHLDLQKIWERTVRRAGLPLAYNQGFHPQAKIQLAAALPLGFSGRSEILDLWLVEGTIPAGLENDLSNGDMSIRLQRAAPAGLTILGIEQVENNAPALQTQCWASEYEVSLLETVDETKLAKHLSAIIDAKSLPRQRRGRTYDLRPLIEEIRLVPKGETDTPSQGEEHSNRQYQEVAPQGAATHLYMRLAAREGATGRPDEVLEVLGIRPEWARIERLRLIFKNEIE